MGETEEEMMAQQGCQTVIYGSTGWTASGAEEFKGDAVT